MYKYFWELKSKQQDSGNIETISKHLSELSQAQRFEVFIKKSHKSYREQMSLKGWSGTGRKITNEEMIASIKLHS